MRSLRQTIWKAAREVRTDEYSGACKEQENYVIETRRWLHAHPELGTKETETTAFIKAQLEELGIPVETFDGITGCIGTIEGGKPERR